MSNIELSSLQNPGSQGCLPENHLGQGRIKLGEQRVVGTVACFPDHKDDPSAQEGQRLGSQGDLAGVVGI